MLALAIVNIVLVVAVVLMTVGLLRQAQRRIDLAEDTCMLRLRAVRVVNTRIQEQVPSEILSDDMVAALRALNTAVEGTVKVDAD